MDAASQPNATSCPVAPSELFAAEVQYWRLEPGVWRRVLERVLEAGLGGVSSYVPWEVHEVEPGRFDFEGATEARRDLVGYLELVKELGLRLAFRPGPFVCNEMDWGGLPRRIVTGDHDWYVLQADGTPAPGYRIARDEGWQPSYLHLRYLDEVRTWLRAVDGVAREFTAARGGPIRTCQLDNEVSYVVRDSMFGADYNPCVVGRGGSWHRWLAAKYGEAASLPYARAYSSFEEVEPPRAIGADIEADLVRYFDWIEFKEHLLAEYLATLRRMHEEFGLSGVAFYTNLNPHRPEGVPTNFVRFARATGGLVGYDFYRSPWLRYSGYSSMARVLKVMEATLPLVWSAEFMGGWWMTEMTQRVPQSHTEFMSLSAMANGCRATSWFMFHDRDCWGDAPVSELGHRRENHAAIARVTALVRELPSWDGLRPVVDLAVAYYRPYMWHCHIGDPNPCADDRLHVGEPSLWGSPAGSSVLEYEGLFRVCQQAGYTAGCVDLTDGAGRLGEFPLVFLAGETFIDARTAALLSGYVRGGGILLVTGQWPERDERGRPLAFFPEAAPATGARRFSPTRLGAGKIVRCAGTLASCEPGAEDPGVVRELRAFLHDEIGPPAVDASTGAVRWRTWREGGGAAWREEPRNLVDAILHRGGGTRVVYVVNVHERAVRAELVFRDVGSGTLRELGGAKETFSVAAGRVTIELDRKSVRVFELV